MNELSKRDKQMLVAGGIIGAGTGILIGLLITAIVLHRVAQKGKFVIG